MQPSMGKLLGPCYDAKAGEQQSGIHASFEGKVASLSYETKAAEQHSRIHASFEVSVAWRLL